MAEMAFNEFSEVCFKSNSVPVAVSARSPLPPGGWSPPDDPFVKVSCDATWVKKTNRGGLGIIIRDHIGIPLHAFTAGFDGVSSLFAKAVAVGTWLLQAAKCGFSSIVVESDCSNLICQINSKSFDLEIIGVGFDILQLQGSFATCFFSLVPRSSNSVADSLARSALSDESPIAWPVTSQWLINLCNLDVTACIDSIYQ
ncbi:uncharacterized protein LOC122654900 [Telopea speciosissima]|uniref:uncharacterized protein LOC122654900 n=1 Tax=Telopea speciosissima TaxID=54955 RepID=UPI001CC48EA2|nr:uncharacterized protein LOC122654900 [Telopea speciosissima]